MTPEPEHAFCGKPEQRPQIWRVMHAGHASGDPSEQPVRICRILQVDGAGERGLANTAGAQRGLAHRSQLTALGIGRGAIAHRISVGSLHHVLPSVLAVGHPVLEPLAAETAALLYAGDDCVLSHATAAAIWRMADAGPHVAITVIGRKVRPQPGLQAYRVHNLDVRDVRLRWGFPLTAPARTLIDQAAVTAGDELERALNEARVLKLVHDSELMAAMERCPLRSGVRRLRRLLGTEHGPALTRSEAERMLSKLVDRAQLPRPRFNARVNGYEVDVLWEEARVVMEADGYDFHGHRAAFERDREKDQRLAAAGYTVIRVTWRQLRYEPEAVMARIAQALARADMRRVELHERG
jgi:very-short-patch-repair endonuclease